MNTVILKIETAYESETITLDDELSIGRTEQADVVLDDPGLSRLNTTFFRDDDEVLIVDEGSSNGTYLNGERLGSGPKVVFDGDRITMGSETEVRIVFEERKAAEEVVFEEERPKKRSKPRAPAKAAPATRQHYRPKIDVKPATKKETPIVLIVAALSTFGIIFLAIIGLLIANYYETSSERTGGRPTPRRNPSARIPIRVIDPLGGQKQEDLDELVQYWEVQEEEINVEDVEEIAGDPATKTGGYSLKVDLAFFKRQMNRTKERGVFGNDPQGRILKRELCCGVPKQTAKIGEMQRRVPPYQIPMDFADLARKRMQGELIELPMATDYWVLDVGGSSNEKEFTTFDFKTGVQVAKPGSADYNDLARLAANFDGDRYDMNNPKHRRQMKIRLLRMFHPRALPVLEKLAKAFQAKFGRPLRITSLSRSMEYQIGLNKFNPNSFKVRGAGSLPPHTSGCAFDLSRKFMPAEEQNFMVNMLAQMENARELDGLREGGANACFHIFIYDDGSPPKGF